MMEINVVMDYDKSKICSCFKQNIVVESMIMMKKKY